MLELNQRMVKKAEKVTVDSGSPAVQATIFTTRIKELTEHLKVNKKDHMARRGLLQLVGKRRRALTYLARKDQKKYLDTVKELGLRK